MLGPSAVDAERVQITASLAVGAGTPVPTDEMQRNVHNTTWEALLPDGESVSNHQLT